MLSQAQEDTIQRMIIDKRTSPEAAAGGPLALVKNGDMIELDVEKRK